MDWMVGVHAFGFRTFFYSLLTWRYPFGRLVISSSGSGCMYVL